MQRHAHIGAVILSKSKQLSKLKNIVLHYRKRFDGKEYPEVLKYWDRVTSVIKKKIYMGFYIIIVTTDYLNGGIANANTG